MILILLAGIACFALCGYQLTRARVAAERDRRAALETVRSAAGGPAETADASRTPALLSRALPLLAEVHAKLWRKDSPEAIDAQLRRAGVSSRLTAEMFMAGRVALTALGFVAGLTLAHGAGRILLAISFAVAGIYVPSFLVSKAAARRSQRIDADLPHFVDQLAIAVEAGMGFDAALSYLLEASDGPLADEMRRVLTELRVGESRRTAMRSLSERVGSDSVTAFANAVIASDQLGAPLGGILHSQAADLRHRRQMHAEERAQKAPVKMLLPMAIFFLPVIFVIILAPAFLGSNGLL
jgi:tight adherence protein C